MEKVSLETWKCSFNPAMNINKTPLEKELQTQIIICDGGETFRCMYLSPYF